MSGSARYWREFEGLWSTLLGVKITYARIFQNEILPLSFQKDLLGSRPPIRADCLCARWATEWQTLLEIVDKHSDSACPVHSRPSFYATMAHRRRRNTAQHDQNSPGHCWKATMTRPEGRNCRQAQRFSMPCALPTQFLRNNDPPKATKHRPA